MTEQQMTSEEAAAILAKPYKLTRKEQRLLAYDMDRKPGDGKTIGDACRDLRTTPMTLFKTRRSLEEKMNRKLDEVLKEQREGRNTNVKST